MWLSFVLLFVSFATYFSLFLALLHGSLNSVISFITIPICLFLAWRFRFSVPSKTSLIPKSIFLKVLYLSVFVLGAIQCYGFFRQDGNQWATLNPCNYGDITFHISLIKGFSSGASFWPSNPVFWQASLRYPLGIDLFSALFDSLSVPLDWNLFFTGLVLLAVLIRVLDIWGGWFAVMAFFFSGGISKLSDIYSKIDMFTTDSSPWKNLVLTVWGTQRGFQFALPAGILVLIKVKEWIDSEAKITTQEKIVVGLLGGSLALFNLHSFGILSLFLVGYALIKRKLPKILLSVYAATLLAGTTIILIFSQKDAPKGSLISWHWNWTMPEEDSAFSYWLRNFLGFGPLLIFYVIKKTKQRPYEWIWLFVLLLLMSSLILAPWRWDQIKVLIWIYLIFAGFIFAEIKTLQIWKRIVIALLCFSAGFFQLFYSTPLHQNYAGEFSIPELQAVQSTMLKTDVNSRFFSLPIHNHPVFYFGRKAVMGHAGHVWSHGYSYLETEAELNQFMRGEGDWKQIANKFGAKYVYWGPREKEKYQAGFKAWMESAKLLLDTGEIQIFQISE